jgi:acetylornithine/N-succinyldiaminopimelate aminotransferase
MSSALMSTYSRLPVAFTHGEGVWLWDTEGRRYLDALAGIAVSGLGHAHPKLVAAISQQAGRVIHTSNVYEVPLQTELAERLVKLSGMKEVFFCNSGSEANEGAIKIARRHAWLKGNTHAHIITMKNSWHGRTLATLAATGSAKAREGFEPLPTGFIAVDYNDIKQIEQAGDNEPRVNAVLLEVLQGEGGIREADLDFLQKVRALCDARGWLLMIDEVQSGIGRTGRWFAHEWANIRPDVMTLAKGLGSGVPIGAVLAGERVAGVMTPGTHGTTFGGNPLVSAAALATLNALEEENLLANATRVGDYLKAALQRALDGTAGVIEVRGRGLMLGIELDRPCGVLVKQALEAGLLINVTRENVVRLLPPLIFQEADAEHLVSILTPLVQQFLAGGKNE